MILLARLFADLRALWADWQRKPDAAETESQRRERLGWKIVGHQMRCTTPRKRLT